MGQIQTLEKGWSIEDRLNSLLVKLKDKAPEETKELAIVVQGIKERNVAILGEDEAFKLTDSSGEVRAFRSVVRLSATDGTLVQPVSGGPFVISAQGYERWEEGAGAITMKPPHVLVGDQMLQNPHVERDPKNGRVLAIYCRTIAFRFTSKGIPQVSDWSTIFDVPAYRLIDLLGKARKFPQAFRLLPNDLKPEKGDRETWASYIFDENTTLWVNTSHEEALNFYAQIINREKKAIDFAQTFSKRNALKHLSGLQKVPGQEQHPISTWNVPVISWRPTNGSIIKWDTTRYSNVAKALVKAAGGDTTALMIEASKGTEQIMEDPGAELEMKEQDNADGDGDAPEEQKGPAPELGQTQETPQDEGKLPPPSSPLKEEPPNKIGTPLEQVKALEKKSPELYKRACREAEIFSPMSEAAALLILRKANEIVSLPPEQTRRGK